MNKCFLVRPIRRTFVAGAVCALIASAVPAVGQTVRTEDGIQIISNPKKPVTIKGVPSTPVLTEDLVIGAAEGDEKYMFSTLYAVQVDTEENIYALDFKEVQIKVFDKSGKHLRTFGKRGQGPSEMQRPARMAVTPDNRILVADFGNLKLLYFSPEGECVDEVPMGKWILLDIGEDTSGRIYGTIFSNDTKGQYYQIMRFDDGMKSEVSIARAEHKRDPRGENYFRNLIFFGLLKNDFISWCQTEKYEFTVVDKSGRTVRRISRDWDQVLIPKKEKEKLMEPGPAPVKTFVPDHYPPIVKFITDDEGRIFVRTYEDAGEGRAFIDVFDAEGRYVAKFSLPAEESLAAIRKGKVYCRINENADGIPQIKRYSLSWR